MASLGIVAAALLATLPPQVIENARIYSQDGILESGSIVIQGDNITQVGNEVQIPPGAIRIDANGQSITPGLIEVQSRLGLHEIDLESSTLDHALRDSATAPAFRAADGLNPLSPRIPIARSAGITSAIVAPTGQVLCGQSFWLDLTATLASLPDPKAPAAMVGGVGKEAALGSGAARGGVWLKLRQIFADARFYRSHTEAFNRGDSRKLALPAIHLEALYPVLDRKIPLVFNAQRASDIATALAFASAEKIRIAISGGAEAYLLAPQLAKAGVAVIIQPSAQMPFTFSTLAARYDSPALLHAAGVPIVISAGEFDDNIRRLRQEAGIAVSHGLPHAAALAAITAAPAALFGRGTEIGTLSVGRRANLVIWSGDPFETTSVATAVYINGKPLSLDNRQRMLARRYYETDQSR